LYVDELFGALKVLSQEVYAAQLSIQ
jgi:hypothetical protein